MSEKDLGRQRDRDRGLSATPQHVCPRPSSGQRWQGAQEQVAVGAVAPGRPVPMTPPPKSSKPFSLCPGQRAAPPYLGPSCSPAWLQLPPARRGQEAGGGVWDNQHTRVPPSSVLLRGFAPGWGGPLGLWFFTVGLSLSVSLSLLPSAAIWLALLPSQPHSRAFSQEAEPEGPPRSGCRDISRGGGLAARGPGKALAAQRGGGGPGGFLSCAADSRGIGTSPRIPASAASYHWQ